MRTLRTILEPIAWCLFGIICKRNQLLGSEDVLVRVLADASLI
jgi:hypothetical protein